MTLTSPSPPYLTALLTSSLISSWASMRRSSGRPCSNEASLSRAMRGAVGSRCSWVVSRVAIAPPARRYPDRQIETPPKAREPARRLAGPLSPGVPHSALEALEVCFRWCPGGASASPPRRWDLEGRRGVIFGGGPPPPFSPLQAYTAAPCPPSSR